VDGLVFFKIYALKLVEVDLDLSAADAEHVTDNAALDLHGKIEQSKKDCCFHHDDLLWVESAPQKCSKDCAEVPVGCLW
jgi:hypothetical protein